MKTEEIFKLLNQGKRDIYEIKKPKKYTLKSILYSYTGKAIKKVTEYVSDALKHDLTIEFKPVLPFRKKDLKGLSKFEILEKQRQSENERGTPTLQDTSVTNVTNVDKGSKGLTNLSKPIEDKFVNLFDLTGKKKKPVEKKVTLIKADGTKTIMMKILIEYYSVRN